MRQNNFKEDPRGPVANARMKVVADAEGVRAVGYHFDPPAVRKFAPWRAEWVKPAGMCRRKVFLASHPRSVRARISAESRYKLYINSRLASRGPADAGQDGAWGGKVRNALGRCGKIDLSSGIIFYDFRNLTMFFRKGANLISIEVAGNHSFIFEAEVILTGGCRKIIKSDLSWSGASRDRGRHTPFIQSEIPPRMECVYPFEGVVRATPGVTVPARPFCRGSSVIMRGSGSFAVKFDRVLSAYIALKVKGGRGSRISIQGNEIDITGGVRIHEVLLDGSEKCIATPFFDSFTVINISASNVREPVEIMDVRAIFTSYPVSYRGSFACSDARLDKIWKACRWGAQICMQDYHLDSPNHQEPLADFGDYMIVALINYHAFGAPWLIRQDIRKFALVLKKVKYQNFHTSYALLWLQALIDYHAFSGDAKLVREMAPFVHGLMRRFAGYIGRNGLISAAPDYMFMDFVTIAGFNLHHPPAVIGQGYMSAFYYRAIQDAAAVAAITGNATNAADYRLKAYKLKEAFNRELWSERKQLYRDGKPFSSRVKPNRWLPADKDIETFSTQVNTLAVLYDLAPRTQQADIMRKVLAEKPLNCQPYFMHFVFLALRHAGLFARRALELMKLWRINPATGTFREMWDRGDYSHGWQCTPLIQLSAGVLGVTSASPGGRLLRIHPLTCGLRWARGSVPNALGDVEVAWERNGARFRMEVAIPAGCEVEVILPVLFPGRPHVLMDGRSQAGTTCRTGSGTHRFIVKSS
ncbi:MAG: alpha-L-rhamnosidase C-terminal domain-containing protein [Kiritimatiellia bacterium]